ncbi:uncharacterized protein [Littorina saxatilis]|uniref:uncharacterized protein n=1 Tax=Littorina saxatilis TaxID=31220 RepID=UPI0038B51904
MSTHLWVDQLAATETDNPIIYYNPQGQTKDTDTLQENNFLLCIQTQFQREKMNRHTHKMVCIDSTHKTTQYDFLLVTLLVIDDYQENVPVAWAIANREDEKTLTVLVFFTAIKAANNEKDIPTSQYFYDWHVDRAWKKNTVKLIAKKEDQAEVYAYLKMVQMETDPGIFNRQLQEFLGFLQLRHKAFHDYFYPHYVCKDKVLLWATCHRIGSLANTNMYAEAFHRVLKTVYFNSKQNRRVDFLIHVLFQYAKNNVFEQFIKAEKGKVTFRTKEIRKRHSAAMGTIKDDYIVNTNLDTEWLVRSTDEGQPYLVTRLNNQEPCQCKLQCSLCGVCTCTFSCQCADFLTHGHYTCKHIYACTKNQTQPNQT